MGSDMSVVDNWHWTVKTSGYLGTGMATLRNGESDRSGTETDRPVSI